MTKNIVLILLLILNIIVIANCREDKDNKKEKEDSIAKCKDGIDNDEDGKIDCYDEDCQGFIICQSPRDGGDIEDIDADIIDEVIDITPDIDIVDKVPDISDIIDTDTAPTCIDNDRDGYGENCPEGPDCDDNDPYNWNNCDNCVDADGDGYFTGCDSYGPEKPEDCDDTSMRCTTNCEDIDNDGIYDCKDGCIDIDGDGAGISKDWCVPDSILEENRCCEIENDCNDSDPNVWISCATCVDNDGDGYYIGCDTYDTKNGPDCDDSSFKCNVDCTKDDNGNNHRDCDEDCIDRDRDGYGVGTDCLGPDCDDTVSLCNVDCSDGDGDSVPDCNFCPATPTVIGRFDTLGFTRDVFVVNNYAYIADDVRGLRVIDVTDKTNPQEIGYYDTPGHAWGVVVLNDIAYVADGDQGLTLIDVSDPTHPSLISSYSVQFPGYVKTIHIEERVDNAGNNLLYAYLAAGSIGVLIVDVTDPQNFELVGQYDTEGTCYGVEVNNNYLYVADGDQGMLILDITDPSSPQPLGRCFFNSQECRITGTSYDVKLIADNFILEADGRRGINIIDVSNPEAPSIFSSLSIVGTSEKVFRIGSYTYIGAGRGGVRIVDTSDIGNPNEVSYVNTSYYIRGIFVKEGYIYAADEEGGLMIISVRCEN